jgi:site-specific recombinase XerC
VTLAANRFSDWAGEEVRLERINAKLLLAYQKYLSTLMCTVQKQEEQYSTVKKKFVKKTVEVKKRQLSDGTITREMTRIKTILSYAVEHEMVSYSVPPFAGVRLQRIRARQNDVSPDAIRKLRDLPLTKPRQCVARDVFMLSFYLGGINYKDILTADLSGDEITYCRQKTSHKTENIVRIPVIAEAREIIQRWSRGGEWYAGFRHAYSGDEIGEIGKHLRDIKKEYGLPSCLTYGSARKSFSQFALEIGINDAVINYLLGHSNYSRGIISYYNQVTPRMAAMALRKVVDYMQHPENYQDEIERAIML